MAREYLPSFAFVDVVARAVITVVRVCVLTQLLHRGIALATLAQQGQELRRLLNCVVH